MLNAKTRLCRKQSGIEHIFRVYCRHFPKFIFPPLLAAILNFCVFFNFCVKHRNMFILETEQDKAISTKFLTHRVSDFWRPSRISALNQKPVYLGNGARSCYFDEMFDPQGICRATGVFSQKVFSSHFWRPSYISVLKAKTRLSRKWSEIERFKRNF